MVNGYWKTFLGKPAYVFSKFVDLNYVIIEAQARWVSLIQTQSIQRIYLQRTQTIKRSKRPSLSLFKTEKF